MAHKRKRPDFLQVVYKFWARPCAALPDEFWAHAKAMQHLWNTLVTYREQFREQVKELPDKERKLKWKEEFRSVCRMIVKEYGLGWESGDDVLVRFETASIRAAKSGANLRSKFRLDKIKIPHRFTGGGMPIDKFLQQTKRATRIRFDPVAPAAYKNNSRVLQKKRITEGVFGVGASTFTFDAILHRPIPSGAIVKQALWCGDFMPTRRRDQMEHRENEPRAALDSRWQWSLQLLCEIPPQEKPPNEDTRPIAGLDLGWRVMGEGSYLRIGYLCDSDGHQIELRLPLAYQNASERSLRLPAGEQRYSSWWDLMALDEKIGSDIQTVKDLLYPMVPPSAHAGWEKLRQGGLKRLARMFAETGAAEQAQELLATWSPRYDRLATLRCTLWERLKGRQDAWYRNLAAWLTQRYQAVCWEGDLSLKDMAETHHSVVDEAALAHAKKFRGWASLFRLRQNIQQAAGKNWCTILDAPIANSTVTCWQCGEIMERNGGALQITCPTHGKMDQDLVAAMNFLQWGTAEIAQTSPSFVQNGVSRKKSDQAWVQKIEIPDAIREVAVLCLQE